MTTINAQTMSQSGALLTLRARALRMLAGNILRNFRTRHGIPQLVIPVRWLQATIHQPPGLRSWDERSQRVNHVYHRTNYELFLFAFSFIETCTTPTSSNMYEAYDRNTHRYSWRNNDKSRNGIRKSLGLPPLPARHWSIQTYSSASDETSSSMSEFIDDDYESEEGWICDFEPVEPQSYPMTWTILGAVFLIILALLAGPSVTLIAAIVFPLCWVATKSAIETWQHLEAQQLSRQKQRQTEEEEEREKISNLLGIFRGTVRNDVSMKEAVRFCNARYDLRPNYTLMADCYDRLRNYADAGLIVKGSDDYREFLELEHFFLGNSYLGKDWTM